MDRAEWASDAQLADAAPQQGIEIRRSSNKAYRPLTCLILDPHISVRKLNVGESFAKFWLSSNRNKNGAILSRYQQTFPPRGDTCLALTEFITGSWTSVYDDGSMGSLSLFPIVLGYAIQTETQAGWNSLQLPRPTMPAKLGTGEWQACPTYPLLIGFSKNILLAAMASRFQRARLKYGCGEHLPC